jgi:hypothetical protein
MNLLKATQVLGLEENWNDVLLKKNYHSLAKMYHPDKYHEPDAHEKITEINEAYEFLKNKKAEPDLQFSFKDILNMFSFKSMNVKNNIIMITAKEFLIGTTKEIGNDCSCPKDICLNCGGCGFTFKGITMETCSNCLGDGFVKCNKCKNSITIKILPKPNMKLFHPVVGKIELVLEKPYFYKNGGIYYTFDITLKESLTGFNKIFKDPFEKEHYVIVDKLIKTNDGYKICTDTNHVIILVFNVIYPKKLKNETIKKLKNIDF